jgi:hypothetical protein
MKPCLDVIVQFIPINNDHRLRQFYINGGSNYERGYSPHFRVMGDKEYLGIEFIQGPDRPVNPGELVVAKVRLMYYPDVSYNKLKVGEEFEILEGKQVVGIGHVKSPIYFEELS